MKELVTKRDNALVILNCGDELTLTFPAAQLPPKRPGDVREFFLFTSGWDKDGDYHVERGLNGRTDCRGTEWTISFTVASRVR